MPKCGGKNGKTISRVAPIGHAPGHQREYEREHERRREGDRDPLQEAQRIGRREPFERGRQCRRARVAGERGSDDENDPIGADRAGALRIAFT